MVAPACSQGGRRPPSYEGRICEASVEGGGGGEPDKGGENQNTRRELTLIFYLRRGLEKGERGKGGKENDNQGRKGKEIEYMSRMLEGMFARGFRAYYHG